tara:strand:- start:604 stop:888 length:285 start_codon:yes stop_codon:yes gene_type:complete
MASHFCDEDTYRLVPWKRLQRTQHVFFCVTVAHVAAHRLQTRPCKDEGQMNRNTSWIDSIALFFHECVIVHAIACILPTTLSHITKTIAMNKTD